MRDYISDRVTELAQYIITNKTTVRAAAKVFGISKSTVHKDITERLAKINADLHNKVHSVLENNNIRGGLATKKKYQKLT